jgi:tetratricopeptide (TPR) repeat protein
MSLLRYRFRTVPFTCVLTCTLTACLPPESSSLNRASTLYERGQYREAAAEYRHAIDLDPSWAPPYLGLGNANRALGDTTGAISAYEQAVAISPEYAEAQIGLGEVLMDLGRWSDAEIHLRKALAVVPRDGRLHAMLGMVLAKEGRDAEALRAFESAEELCKTCLVEEERSVYSVLKNDHPN